MNFYQRQWGYLHAALKHAEQPRRGELAERFFRLYHGYQNRDGAWRLFTDDRLLRLASGLWHTRRNDPPWRRLWCVTLDEVARRGLLPTLDDLRVAWDACLNAGYDQVPSLLDVWVLGRKVIAR